MFINDSVFLHEEKIAHNNHTAHIHMVKVHTFCIPNESALPDAPFRRILQKRHPVNAFRKLHFALSTQKSRVQHRAHPFSLNISRKNTKKPSFSKRMRTRASKPGIRKNVYQDACDIFRVHVRSRSARTLQAICCFTRVLASSEPSTCMGLLAQARETSSSKRARTC